jgi:predicted phage-related endonuclease
MHGFMVNNRGTPRNKYESEDYTMSNLESRIREYREYKRLAEEAQAVADGIADELKAHMTNSGETALTVGEYKLSYTPYTSNRVDTAALKRELPDIAERYTKTTETRRFSVA